MRKLSIALCLIPWILTSCPKGKTEFKNESTAQQEKQTTIVDSTEDIGKPYVNPIEIYTLSDLEENTKQKIGFVSLSDNYPLSEHQDSLAIPSLSHIKNQNELEYFVLDAKYRNRFLNKIGVSETDSLFIFDYSTNTLRSFLIKNLPVAANLSIYSYRETYDEPLTQYDYEIGFGIDKSRLAGIDSHGNHVLVYVGKEHPFVLGQMKAIRWKVINANEFPIAKSLLPNSNGANKGNAYSYSSDNYQYFIQNLSNKDQEYSDRHLIVEDRKSGRLVIERIFKIGESESPAPLNFGVSDPKNPDLALFDEQWTGKLFKDKPDVVFGFEYHSFGCPNIIFLNPKAKDIYLNCDNRH